MLRFNSFPFMLWLVFSLPAHAQFETLGVDQDYHGYTNIHCSDGDCLFVRDQKVGYSNDLGNTIDILPSPNYMNGTRRIGTIVGPGKFYLPTYETSLTYEFYLHYSADYGQSWDTLFSNGGPGVIDSNEALNYECNDASTCFINLRSGTALRTVDQFETLDTLETKVHVTDATNNAFIVGVYDARFVYSTNGGQDWISRAIPDANHLLSATSINQSSAIVLDQEYGDTTHSKYVHVTNDLGETWQRYEMGTHALEVQGDIAFVNDSIGLAVGEYDGVQHRNVVIWTEDQGVHWDTITVPSNFVPSDIAIANDSIALIAIPGGMLMRLKLNELPEPNYLTVTEPASLNTVVYPNPVSDVLNVHLEYPQSGTVRCFGMDGRMTFSQRINASPLMLDVHQLNPGIYFLSIESDDGHQTLKFVKQ